MGRTESPRPNKFTTQPCAGKVMTTVLWDAKCVNMFDILQTRGQLHRKRRDGSQPEIS